MSRLDRDQALAYLRSSRRSWRLNGVDVRRVVARADDRALFVVGSPRSGTSFTAETIGQVPGFADLGELRPLKRRIPDLVRSPESQVAREVRTTVRLAQRVGLSAGLRAIEQTPESTYLVPAIARAFPRAQFLHMVRDGRDVAASLVALGWVRSSERTDEAGHAFGTHARFWVEPERAAEFEAVSETRRAAWVWRRYASTARTHLAALADRSMELRYEDLVTAPERAAERLAAFLDVPEADAFVTAFGATRSTASGRWRRDLSAEQLADVQAEAGGLLAELGYR